MASIGSVRLLALHEAPVRELVLVVLSVIAVSSQILLEDDVGNVGATLTVLLLLVDRSMEVTTLFITASSPGSDLGVVVQVEAEALLSLRKLGPRPGPIPLRCCF